MGVATWYAGVNNNIRTNGGSFTNNKFTTGPQGYFGYGVSVAGHNGATVTGSSFSNVNFGGVYSSSCFKGMPAMQPLVYNSMRDTGNTLQTGFLDANYQLAIWCASLACAPRLFRVVDCLLTYHSPLQHWARRHQQHGLGLSISVRSPSLVTFVRPRGLTPSAFLPIPLINGHTCSLRFKCSSFRSSI